MLELTLNEIKTWAETTELDEWFESLEEEDPDFFEHQIRILCDDNDLLEFLLNKTSTKRIYFAGLLAESLCSVYRYEFDLPYHFSRFSGVMTLQDYQQKLLEQSVLVYEKCQIIEKMRQSELKEVKYLGDKILDYRNQRVEINSENYISLIRGVVNEISCCFKQGVTNYQLRLCINCGTEFRHWYNELTLPENSKVKCNKCGAVQA